MSKARSGGTLSAFGGGQPRATRAAGYSADEMKAMSKMTPIAPDGKPVSNYNRQVAPDCDICGRLIEQAGPHDPPGSRFDFEQQAAFIRGIDSNGKAKGMGRHMMCHAFALQDTQAKAAAAYAAMPEDEKAARFNEGQTIDPATGRPIVTAAKPAPYVFRPGELPLRVVEAKGGVSKVFADPVKPAPTVQDSPFAAATAAVEKEIPDDVAALQQAAAEAQLQAALAEELAILKAGGVDNSAHDRAAAEQSIEIPLGES